MTRSELLFYIRADHASRFVVVGSHHGEPKDLSLMKTLLSMATIAAFFGLAVAPAIAQTQTTTTNSSTTYVETSKFIGKPVKSSSGEEIGTVKDVVLDRNTGCMAYTVLSTSGGGGGGRVSGGGKMVAVPWTVYSPTSDVSALTVTVDRDRIFNAPVFDYARIEEYSRPDYINNVYSYYGVSPGAAVGGGVSGGTSTTTTGANTTTGAATGAGARTGAAASPAGAASPERSPMGTASPTGRGSPAARATAAGRSPHATPSGRTHESATPITRGGATGTSPMEERTRGGRGTREQPTPPTGRGDAETGRNETGRGETGTRSETGRTQSEEGATGEKATGSQRHQRGGTHEATTPPEKPEGQQ